MEVVLNKKVTLTHKKMLNIYIVYDISLWPFTVNKDFVIFFIWSFRDDYKR